jgi:LacI family transcriptional regulator
MWMARQIAIIFNQMYATPFVLEVAVAMREFAHQHGEWLFHVFSKLTPSTLESIAEAQLDGVIAVALTEDDAYLMEGCGRLSIPAVHAGELHVAKQYHEVRTPNIAIGQMGAQHLMDRGVRHFAFVGDGHRISNNRSEGFAAALAEAGHRDVMTLVGDVGLAEMLMKLPKPAGIMASYDPTALMVAHQAFRLGIRIPEQIALVGVGNVDPWCTLATPPLSSIVLPSRIVGLEAAAMLDKLMRGQPVPTHIDVPSPHVIERESTAVAHGATPEIAMALRYIQQRFRRPITVKEVSEFAGISRSSLERGMKQALGRTPLQAILHLRFEAVRELLAETDLSVKAIALRCGFPSGPKLSSAFALAEGMTPTEYRRKRRGYPAAGEHSKRP